MPNLFIYAYIIFSLTISARAKPQIMLYVDTLPRVGIPSSQTNVDESGTASFQGGKRFMYCGNVDTLQIRKATHLQLIQEGENSMEL